MGYVYFKHVQTITRRLKVMKIESPTTNTYKVLKGYDIKDIMQMQGVEVTGTEYDEKLTPIPEKGYGVYYGESVMEGPVEDKQIAIEEAIKLYGSGGGVYEVRDADGKPVFIIGEPN